MGFDLLGFQIWPLTLGNILFSIFFWALFSKMFGEFNSEAFWQCGEGGRRGERRRKGGGVESPCDGRTRAEEEKEEGKRKKAGGGWESWERDWPLSSRKPVCLCWKGGGGGGGRSQGSSSLGRGCSLSPSLAQ